jgi:hypothetical protein
VAVDVDVVVRGREVIGTTVVSGVLISACVGLVQPAESAQRRRPSVAKRVRVYFMKNAFIF